MVSKFKLKKPCPCGSGKLYGECCAPGRHHRKRQKKVEPEEENQPLENRDEQVERLLSVMEHSFFAVLEGWIRRFAGYYNQSIDYLMEFDIPFVDDLIREVEVEPKGKRLNESQTMAVVSWMLFHRPDLVEEEEGEIRGVVREFVGSEAAEIFEEMEKARFGAWEVREEKESLKARILDGNGESELFPVQMVMNHRWDEVRSRKKEGSYPCYTGWLVDLGEGLGKILFFVEPLSGSSVEKAVRRSGWGEGEEFRSSDYEEDMIALRLNRDARDLGGKEGRIFLDPDYVDRPSEYLSAAQYWAEEMLELRGLHNDSEYDYFRSMLLDVVRLERWEEEDPDFLNSVLEKCYDHVLNRYNWYKPPAWGRKTFRRVLGRPFLFESFYGMPPDGKLKSENLEIWESFPVEALDLERGKLREWGISREWTIKQSRRWGAENLAGEEAEKLEEAVRRFREMLRLGAYLGQAVDSETGKLKASFDMETLSHAVEELFPARLLEKPLKAFPEAKKNTWKRIESGFLAAQELQEGESLTLKRLCEGGATLQALPKVGPKTVEAAFYSLMEYAIDWPQSEGFHSLASPVSGEAAEAISEGLDELGKLF